MSESLAIYVPSTNVDPERERRGFWPYTYYLLIKKLLEHLTPEISDKKSKLWKTQK